MRKLVLFMHCSLDGFAAGPNGEMDWIHVDEEMFDYAGQQTDLADTAVYGRVTYEMMEGYWPTAGEQPNASKHDREHSRWYNSVPKIVISKTLNQSELVNTDIISENVAEQIQKYKEKEGKNLLMFGSPSTAHALMHDNLIDEYWLFINPVILGKGIPVFDNVNSQINLTLNNSKALTSGVVVLQYDKKL